MSFREWFSVRSTEFLWSCFTLFLVAVAIWAFGSFFTSAALFLLVCLMALLPFVAVMAPIFLLYMLIRAVLDLIRGRR